MVYQQLGMHTPLLRMQVPILEGIGPSVELARPRMAPDSNNTPQVFYMAQEMESQFLKGPELTMPQTHFICALIEL